MSRLHLAIISLLFTNFAYAELGTTDALIAIKIMDNSDQSSLNVLSTVESAVKNPSFMNVTLMNANYELNPPKAEIETPKMDKFLSAVSGIDVPALSDALLPGKLDDESRKVLYDRVQNLIWVYNDPNTSQDSKNIIDNYLTRFLKIDVNKIEESDYSTPELAVLSSLKTYIDESKGDITAAMKAYSDDLKKQVIDETKKVVDSSTEQVLKAVNEQADHLEKTQGNSTALVLNAVDQNQLSLEFLELRAKEQELKENILKETNHEKLSQLITQADNCASTVKNDDCAVMKGQKSLMVQQHDYMKAKATHDLAIGSLNMFESMAKVFGNADLAQDISKTKFAVETAFKISEKIGQMNQGMSMISMAASMTNVVGLAFTAVSMFSGGGGSDAAILGKLIEIQKAIEKLRKEMHERFNGLSTQIAHLSVSVNLKLDHTNDNIAVLAANQTLITQLIEENSLAIAELATVQSNQSVGENLSRLVMLRHHISSENDPGDLDTAFDEALSLFAGYLEHSEGLQLLWPKSTSFSWDSNRMLYVVNQAKVGLPQTNYAMFSLMDYLMKLPLVDEESKYLQLTDEQKASAGKPSGVCSKVDINNLYLFNILGSAYVPLLRINFRNNEIEFSKRNKFLSYLMNNDLSPQDTIELFDAPLRRVDKLIEKSDNCFNSYATINEKKVNLVSYLVHEYGRVLMTEFNRIVENAAAGKHLTAMKNAIADTTQGYFEDKNFEKSFFNLDKDNEKRRELIDLTKVDFTKSFQDNILWAKEQFYKDFGTVEPCTLSVDGSKVEAFQKLNIPRGLFEQIFTNDSFKLSLYMGLNSMPSRVCYHPGEQHLVMHQPADMPSAVAFYLYLNWDKRIYYSIPVFAPSNDLEWTIGTGLDFVPDENGESGHEGSNVSYSYYTIVGTSIVEFINDKLPTASFTCKPLNGLFSNCWVTGAEPLEKYYADVNQMYGPPMPGLGGDYLDRPAWVEANAMLTSKEISKVFGTIQEDVQRCIHQALMGFYDCKFGDYRSLETIEKTANFKSAERINLILRHLTPILSKFKVNDVAQHKQYIANFDLGVISAQEILVRALSAKGNKIDNLKSELQEVEKALKTVEQQSNDYLKIDTRSLIKTDTYDAVRFYRNQTQKALEEKALLK